MNLESERAKALSAMTFAVAGLAIGIGLGNAVGKWWGWVAVGGMLFLDWIIDRLKSKE